MCPLKMKAPPSRLIAKLLLSVLALWSAALHAQGASPGGAPVAAPRAGERLSDWLLRQPNDARAYPLGLHWQVPAERYAQAGQKRELLFWLAAFETPPAAARENLARMLNAMTVTGRVPVPLADPRWLQAHPREDPLLQRDHVLLLPQRPATVSVLTSAGKRCTLPHRTGSEALDYLKACEPQSIERVDRAWVVQADGSVRELGIARWNAEAQDEAAPGALIWAPARDSGFSPQFSTLLVQFLSTQSYDAIVSAALPSSVEAAPNVIASGKARDAMVTANDWGVIGLLQTPTARMAMPGEARFHFSRVEPYERSSVLLQPLDWLEAGFRYTTILNRQYGPAEFSGRQTYKDKSIDFKLRLLKETASLPQLAMGITDIGGTGLFSSEYVVANKRSGNFDWSLGMGWGYMGGSGNIPNPLSLLGGKRFDTRSGSISSSGGQVNATSFFHGTTALFGGVQYHTPSDKWLFKAEYDGNNYQREPLANNLKQRTPINLGLVYRYSPNVDFAVGLQRGNTLMLGLSLHTALDKLDAPKVSDAPVPRIVRESPTVEPQWAATAGDITAMSNWSVRQISREGGVLQVVIESASGAYWNDRIERLTAVLHRDAPAAIYGFDLIFIEQGIPMAKRMILREPWVKKTLQFQTMSDDFQTVAAAEPRAALPATSLWEAKHPRFGYSIVPSLQQNIGGPDAFLLFKAGVSVPMRLKLSEDISISGTVSLGLLDNFAKFKYTAPSNLPRVRTFVREYTTASPITVPNLQITHLGKLAGSQYYSVYGGLLENTFAGVGGEWLYRPFHSPIAFGIDLNWVQQRSFQGLGFGNAGTQTGYRATTGHATGYWDTGWKSTQVKLSAGQYLAKDIGATLEISRTFKNGVSIGVFATKTDVSAEVFGEGSFDKGIYVRIPFDVMTTTRGPGLANLVYNPLTRDGGAKLNRSVDLYSTTKSRSQRETGYAPAGAGAGDLDTEAKAPIFSAVIPETVSPKRVANDFANAGRTALDMNLEQAGAIGIATASAIFSSSAMDKRAFQFAKDHQNSRALKNGIKVGNALPWVGLAGAALVALDGSDPKRSRTGFAAAEAGVSAALLATGIKYAVGRSRPEDGLGTHNFNSFSGDNRNSAFPSRHASVAWAVATPFALEYDMPWLYGLSALTTIARVGSREHWVSDAVAGSLLGYVMGGLFWESSRADNKYAPRVAISRNGISLAWDTP